MVGLGLSFKNSVLDLDRKIWQFAHLCFLYFSHFSFKHDRQIQGYHNTLKIAAIEVYFGIKCHPTGFCICFNFWCGFRYYNFQQNLPLTTRFHPWMAARIPQTSDRALAIFEFMYSAVTLFNSAGNAPTTEARTPCDYWACIPRAAMLLYNAELTDSLARHEQEKWQIW